MSTEFNNHSSESRWTDKRVSWLQRQYDLRANLAEVIAWSELGYSSSGIAKRAGLSETTVKSMLEEVTERFCIEATFAVPEEHRAVGRGLPGR